MRRRKAREIALQILFSLESQDQLTSQPYSVAEIVNQYVQNFFPNVKEEVLDRPYLEKIIRQISPAVSELDKKIEDNSSNWKLSRMTKVDRNILRIGALELEFFLDIPAKVVIDESIELAKKFGNEDSAAFINGILDQIRAKVRPKEVS